MTALHPATDDIIEHLRRTVTGRVVLPDDVEYDDARTLFYGDLDRRPAAVVYPADTEDVARVVRLAADSESELAVRSGGHGILGHAGIDDGIVLDLGDMTRLELDVDGRTAWVEAGATTGDYTHAAGAHGLATGFGDAGTVGIGGLTVGGGIGLLTRKHGMTIDQLLAAQVVTADGQVHHVDASTEPDLFWAIRGGGGNVGVATRFQFRLHDVPSIVGGFLVLPLSAEVIAGFVAAAEAAPDELTTLANVMSAAPPMPFLPTEVHGQPVVLAMLVYAGDTEEGERVLAQFRSLATPLADLTGPMDYADMFPRDEDEIHPTVVIETMFRDSFDLDTADAVVEALASSTALAGVVQLRVLGGAMGRVPVDATAFAHRDRRLMVNVAAMFADRSERPTHKAWVDRTAATLSDGYTGRYVNFLGTDGNDAARAAYPAATRQRLAAIKATHDPDNLFRHNVNVAPATTA